MKAIEYKASFLIVCGNNKVKLVFHREKKSKLILKRNVVMVRLYPYEPHTIVHISLGHTSLIFI